MATERSAFAARGTPGDDRGRVGSEGMPRAVWLLVGTIAAAKVTTLAVIVWASGSRETLGLIVATLPPWLLAAGALLAGPLLFRLRLRRVRARRERLRRAEWMLPPAEHRPRALGRAARWKPPGAATLPPR
jgi:hypothetical protein